MFGNHSPEIVHTRRSFASSFVLAGSFVLVALIGSVTAVGIYGLNIVDRKTGNIFEFVEEAMLSLPEIAEALPPVLADLINDQRRPEYADQLDISVKLAATRSSSGVRPMVVVRNLGDQIVSLLSMRVVVLNDRDELVAEFNEWAATPIAADHDWRGPLLPGATRHFATSHRFVGKKSKAENLRVEFEITDVRVWNHGVADAVALTSAR